MKLFKVGKPNEVDRASMGVEVVEWGAGLHVKAKRGAGDDVREGVQRRSITYRKKKKNTLVNVEEALKK